MNLDRYQELSGVTVPSSISARYEAQIRRVKILMENMLGYTLDKKKSSDNFYEEKGKSALDFSLPDDDDDLLPPDDYEIGYRLFRFNEHDQFIAIDPCLTVYSVKLVFIEQGDAPNGITLKTFTNREYRQQVGPNGVVRYLDKVDPCWFNWWAAWAGSCGCEDWKHVQVAVDADWLFYECLPAELEFLMADMVTYYADPSRDLKSQSLGSHSWTKAEVVAPEKQEENISILKKYAGPYGSLTRTLTL